MRKFFAVFKREYLQVVRKKSFIIMTLLLPFFLMAMMIVPSLLMVRGASGRRVAILDGTGRLGDAFQKPVTALRPLDPSNAPPATRWAGAAGATCGSCGSSTPEEGKTSSLSRTWLVSAGRAFPTSRSSMGCW